MDIDITELDENEINKKIREGISNPDVSSDEVIKFVKDKCQTISLKPWTLGMLFEMYVGIEYDSDDKLTYFSDDIKIKELTTYIHPDFETSNGSTWARSHTSYLGKKYDIVRNKKSGKIYSVRLDGPNSSVERFRGIREDIRQCILQQRCSILDINNNVEVDHKNGRYNNLSDTSPEEQMLSDFQPLSRAANVAKRGHCNLCKKIGKRYDARRLGYKEGWIAGDENTQNCIGCYWYDPKEFNTRISLSFNKER